MAAYLGEFEQLVLLAILRLGPRATGSAIRAAVEEGGRRTVWIGAVHTTLERLDAKGLVRSRLVADPHADADRRRKVYAIEPAGRTAIAHAHDTWVRMTRGLKPKLEPR
jgi:DNA-binding PadR family transcriptional regulator